MHSLHLRHQIVDDCVVGQLGQSDLTRQKRKAGVKSLVNHGLHLSAYQLRH